MLHLIRIEMQSQGSVFCCCWLLLQKWFKWCSKPERNCAATHGAADQGELSAAAVAASDPAISPALLTASTGWSLQSPNCCTAKMKHSKGLSSVYTKLKVAFWFWTQKLSLVSLSVSGVQGVNEQFLGSTGYPTQQVRHCLGQPWILSALTHSYETGKALGLDKEWFSKSEGLDRYFKFTWVNTHGGKGR